MTADLPLRQTHSGIKQPRENKRAMGKPRYSFLILLGCLCWLEQASATTVRQLNLAEPNENSDMILHARVAHVDEYYGAKDNAFRTLLRFEIIESLKGEKPSTFDMVLTGGSRGTFFSWIPGMPRFRIHDEVVVFLHKTRNDTHIFTGLGQGVFFIKYHRHIPTLEQQIGGMHIIGEFRECSSGASD